jgi:hypothetical protein
MARGRPRDGSKNPGGRPVLYKPEYNEQVEKLCRLGATDAEIADFFGVCEATINNWKLSEPMFLESLKKGKIIADMEVANSLYNRAKGYEQEVVKVFQFQGEPVIVPIIEKIAPDTGAAMAWLKNRRPKDWRDKQELDISGALDINKKTTLIDRYLSDDET